MSELDLPQNPTKDCFIVDAILNISVNTIVFLDPEAFPPDQNIQYEL